MEFIKQQHLTASYDTCSAISSCNGQPGNKNSRCFSTWSEQELSGNDALCFSMERLYKSRLNFGASKISNVTCSDADDELQFDFLQDISECYQIPGQDHLPLSGAIYDHDTAPGTTANIRHSFQEPICAEDNGRHGDVLDTLLVTTGKCANLPFPSKKRYCPSNHSLHEISQHNHVSLNWSQDDDAPNHVERGPQELLAHIREPSLDPLLGGETHDQAKHCMDCAQLDIDVDLDLYDSDSDGLCDFEPAVSAASTLRTSLNIQQDLFDNDSDDITPSIDDRPCSPPLFEENQDLDLLIPERSKILDVDVDYDDAFCDEEY